MKCLFRPQLEECARDGTLGCSLWVPIRLVCMKLTGSTQEMEALNKLVKMACKRAPTISLGLLDARTPLASELEEGRGRRTRTRRE
eukprot:2988560-Pyramimonas_sp.AAC.1